MGLQNTWKTHGNWSLLGPSLRITVYWQNTFLVGDLKAIASLGEEDLEKDVPRGRHESSQLTEA